MIRYNNILLLILLACFQTFFSSEANAQNDTLLYTDEMFTDSVLGVVDTAAVSKFPYVRYSHNRFFFPSEESPAFENFYARFDSLINFRKGQLTIYHIGGSHIQADIYSNKVRTYMNTYWPGLYGARGTVFPYTLAGTNNPWNYRVDSIGKWEGHRCVVRTDTTRMGLMGITVNSKDSIAGIKFYYREKEEMRYIHDRIRVLHYHNPNYEVSLGDSSFVKEIVRDTLIGYTEFILNRPVEEFTVYFRRIAPDSLGITVNGISLLNKLPGIIYNSIGVNGAAFPNYLKCQDMESQLSLLPPDLFILSVGTNDANVRESEFDPSVYKANLKSYLDKILSVNPKCALVLTVPNDAYYYRRYPNKNVAREREVIFELAKEYQMAVWDFYGIMGELGSSHTWYQDKLMHKDRVHFTWEGYNFKGDLFFEAFLKYLDEFEFRRLVKYSND